MSYQIRLWRRPQPGLIYGIGGDVAEGLPDGDDSVYEVLRADTKEQCCEVWGKIPPVEFGELGLILGLWYNKALIGIENNKDLTPLHVLNEMGYENIYKERRESKLAWKQFTAKMGWNTNTLTRRPLVNRGRRALTDGAQVIYSHELWQQWHTFVLLHGKYQAMPGAHDDGVMAYLIASEMCDVALQRDPEGGEQTEERDTFAAWSNAPLTDFGQHMRQRVQRNIDKTMEEQHDKTDEALEYALTDRGDY